jgi:hypothetical protein
MAEVGTAVPSNVNLSKQKPYAVSAYSRRVKSLANNAQAFGPDSYVNITLDTSTPGSFLDPLQSYLKFDLTIRNTNAFADFVSFGPAGAASLIEEFRIYVQGTPIEEILQYNVFYELAMNQNGQCQQPYHLFKTNEMPLGIASIFHQNAIKPPMVDNEGRPMYGSVVNATTGQARGRQCAWAYAEGDSLLQSKMIQSQATFSSKIPFSGCRPYYLDTAAKDVVWPIYTADAHSLLLGSRNGSATTSLAQGTWTVTNAENGALFPAVSQSISGGTQVNFVDLDTFTGVNISQYTSGSAQVGLDADRLNVQFTASGDTYQTTFASYFNNGNGILPYAGSSVEFPSIIGGSNTVESNPDFDPRNPLNWCNLLPATEIRPDMRTLGPDNLQDYFMFLANTKYIPIGMQGWNKYAAGTEQFDTASYPSAPFYRSNNFTNLNRFNPLTNEASFSYTCCIPLISGVLGSFADKCWPTMLIAPGSMYIQIRTASPQKAFQLSMDPCRRVLGTIRDYLPFGGSMGGLFGQLGENTSTLAPDLVLDGNLGAGSTFYNTTPSGTQINDSGATNVNGCLPFNTFSEYKATTSFNVNTNATSVIAAGVKAQSMINGYGCIGATLGSANQRLTDTYFAGQGIGAGILFRPYSVAAMEGRWTIGRAYISQFAGADQDSYFQATQESSLIIGSGAGTNVVPAAMNSSFDQTYGAVRTPAMFDITLGSNDIACGAYPNAPLELTASGLQAVMPQADVTVELNPSGIPLPQYWLHAQPWTKKNFMYLWSAGAVAGVSGYTGGQLVYYGATQDGLASEADACYGTFLASSIPQSRRVLTHQSGVVSYTLSNIEFVSQQIILPDSVSSSILADAAQGDISLTSNSLHNYQTPISQSTSQNLIIPAKIASANTMYCLFVPQIFVSGAEAYLYNSLRGICPFGAVSDTTDGGIDRNGLTGPYSDIGLGTVAGRLLVNNIPCSGSNFQIQLKVGNELIPQQPLTTITELVSENVKAQHKLFDTTSNVNQTYSLCTRAVNVVGSTDHPPSVLSFDVLKSGNFTTTFVSAVHCDDQTAINNPANGYLYAAEANRIALAGGDPIQWEDFVIPRNPCQLELFQPPESSFVIAFDMDTWSRFSDVTRSGKFLGNNTITLTLQGATALGLGNSQTGSNGYVLQTFVVHDIRFSFQAGGSVVSYY